MLFGFNFKVTIISKKKTVLFLLLLPAFGFTQDYYESFRADLYNDMSMLGSWMETGIDPDSLCFEIGSKLVGFINQDSKGEFNLFDFPGLEETISPSEFSKIRVYVFGYYSYGSAGSIHFPIIIDETYPSHKYAYSLVSSKTEIKPYCVHTLKENCYLLIGTAPGSGTCRGYCLLAVKLNKEAQDLNCPVFNGRSSLFICNTEHIYYDEYTQTLEIEAEPTYYSDNPIAAMRDNYPYCDVIEYQPDHLDYEVVRMSTVFNGKEFVKPSKH